MTSSSDIIFGEQIIAIVLFYLFTYLFIYYLQFKFGGYANIGKVVLICVFDLIASSSYPLWGFFFLFLFL
jgi:hypothetical protein